MSQIRLILTTPYGVLVDENVDIITVKTADGYRGFMANHQPTISTVEISTLMINSERSANHRKCSIANGLIYAERNQITIVTSAAEFADQIDVKRAEKARDEAQKLIDQLRKSGSNSLEQELRLMRSINRIHTAGQK